MSTSSLLIRPASTADELRTYVEGYVQVAQSFSPDPLPQDMASRLLDRLTTQPGFRLEQIRCAYRDGEYVGGYRIAARLLRIGAARLLTGCIGGVYTHVHARKQGVASALMQDAITYAQAHGYALLLLDGIPRFYHRYGFCDVYDLSTLELDHEAVLALPPSSYAYGMPGLRMHLPCSRSMSATLAPPLAALTAHWSSSSIGRAIWSQNGSGWPSIRQAGFGAISSFSTGTWTVLFSWNRAVGTGGR
jgi:predicted N-acetyltransferase YhbS